MIRYSQYLLIIGHVFAFGNAEPLYGEKVVPAKPFDFPFVASLGLKHPNNVINRESFCTGSLITMKHVLTAEHCIRGLRKSEFDVAVGEIDLSIIDRIYEVDSMITYNVWARRRGEYNDLTNDVAIVKLASLVNQVGVMPVKLTHLNIQQLYGKIAVVVGWRETKKNVEELFKGKVSILTLEQCERQLELVAGEPFGVTENIFCGKANPNVLGECGDSGGPILDKNNVLLGVIRSKCPNVHWGSYSQEFLNKYKVNIYSSVDYYREFIVSVTKLAC